MKDIEIAKVLYLSRNHKYETAVAAFDAVDHIFKLDVPRNLRTRKLAVQAMSLMADGVIRYGYDGASKATLVDDSDEE